MLLVVAACGRVEAVRDAGELEDAGELRDAGELDAGELEAGADAGDAGAGECVCRTDDDRCANRVSVLCPLPGILVCCGSGACDAHGCGP